MRTNRFKLLAGPALALALLLAMVSGAAADGGELGYYEDTRVPYVEIGDALLDPLDDLLDGVDGEFIWPHDDLMVLRSDFIDPQDDLIDPLDDLLDGVDGEFISPQDDFHVDSRLR